MEQITDCNKNKEGHKDKENRSNTMKGMTFNKGWNELYCGIVVDNLVNIDLPAINYLSPTPITNLDTAIANTGARGLYLSENPPQSDNNPFDPPIIVGTITSHIQTYMAIRRTPPPTCPISCTRRTYYQPSTNHSLGSATFLCGLQGPLIQRYCHLI